MVIKELEIQGFKSFATKTRLTFDRPITAVVGPNGCGKSNILDALKWVLGEKSVKSIRGESMQDVIFSGTDTKNPANFAQVSLTLDNSGRVFDLAMNEVKLSRRVYRDGQSQYFINDSRVTRRELEHLLMDTGLGKTSYNFMEQNRMDMILSSKPEDRRIIFEEAAGISRFKAQREEAEKNLENAQLNITRLQDIISELEREVKLKTGQAEKTEKYNKLLEDQKEHDLRIKYLNLRKTETSLIELDEKLQKKLQDKEKIKQKIIQLEEKVMLFEKDRDQKQQELHQKDITNQVSREKIAQWQNLLEEQKTRRELLVKEKENIAQQMSLHEKRLKNLRTDLNGQNQLTLELDVRLEDAQATINDLQQKSDRALEQIENLKKEREAYMGEEAAQNATLLELRAEHESVIQELLIALKQEKENWQKHEQEQLRLQKDVTEAITGIETDLQSIIDNAKDGKAVTLGDLRKIQTAFKNRNLAEEIGRLGLLGQSLRHLLFEKGGIHSKKEELDEEIKKAQSRLGELDELKKNCDEEISAARDRQIKAQQEQETIRGDLKSFEVQKTSIKEREKNLNDQVKHEEASVKFFKEKYNYTEDQILFIDQEARRLEGDINNLKTGIEKEVSKIESLEKQIARIDEQREKIHKQIFQENEKNSTLFEAVNELEIKHGTLMAGKEALIQEVFNDYNLTYAELEEQFSNSRINLDKEKEKISEIQQKIEELGPINPLAIEELKTVQKLYDHNETQLNDIVDAKKNILAVIEEIHEKSEKLFLDSFGQIQQNFQSSFQKLFKGGQVKLELQDADKPLESGIDIQVQPPGKRPKSLRVLSGGEKTLTAIALMFAIYLVRSSPFCVLDEIDAPLDDQNVGRFLTLLNDFLSKSQFILITHNKKTMAHADAIFGVTMQEPGVSRLLSVELSKGESG